MISRGYLLDTHILIWIEHSPKRIGKKSRKILERGNLYYSSISVLEIGLKSKMSNQQLSVAALDGWNELGIKSISFDDSAAIAFASIASAWLPDPFDRQIVATAMDNSLRLITADQRILQLGYDWIIDATT